MEGNAVGTLNHYRWNLLIRTPLGPAVLSFVERLSSFRGDFIIILSVYTRVLLASPLLRALSECPLSCIMYTVP